MTSKQRIAILADWWPRACEVQGWRRDDREKRLEVVSEAIGRRIETFNDLNNSDDIDKVKALLGMLSDEIKSTVELTPAGEEFGYRRRLYWLIRKHARHLGGEPYILQLARDRFHIVPGLRCAMTIILPIQCQLKFPVAPVYLCVVFHCLFHCL